MNQDNYISLADMAERLGIKLRWARKLVKDLEDDTFGGADGPACVIRDHTSHQLLILDRAVDMLKNRKTKPGAPKGTDNKVRTEKRITRRLQIEKVLSETPDVSPYILAKQVGASVATVYRDLEALGIPHQ